MTYITLISIVNDIIQFLSENIKMSQQQTLEEKSCVMIWY
jgi:hypothetical protein